MKARLFPFGDEAHRRAEERLPWYANGTLDADEAAEVAAHLRECERCQADLRGLDRIRASDPAVPETPGAVDVGWARLRAAIDDEQRAAAPAHASPPRAKPRSRPPRWLAWTLAAQMAAIAGVAVLFGVAGDRTPYRALGAASPRSANALVVFAPATTESEIRALLRAEQAQVVAGPTSTDAWLVQVPQARLDAAIAAWRARPAVQRAESLESPAPPPARNAP